MNDQKQNQRDADLDRLFGRVKDLAVEAPPFLATRVLARVRERRESSRKLRFWRYISLGLAGSFALVAVALLRPLAKEERFEAQVGKPHVVMVKVQDLQSYAVAKAEIELPDGVFFHSESFPAIREKRSLQLAWNQSAKRPFLPFVLEANTAGEKVVRMRFRDQAGKVLLERQVHIVFRKAES